MTLIFYYSCQPLKTLVDKWLTFSLFPLCFHVETSLFLVSCYFIFNVFHVYVIICFFILYQIIFYFIVLKNQLYKRILLFILNLLHFNVFYYHLYMVDKWLTMSTILFFHKLNYVIYRIVFIIP